MLIGNKCDAEIKRVVDEKKGMEVAKSLNIPFLETSAKININVKRAFHEIAEMILENQLDSDQNTNVEKNNAPSVNLQNKNNSYKFLKTNCC